MDNLTPIGVYDFSPEEMARFDAILSSVIGVFSRFGYQKIRTPSLEYYDTLSIAMGADFGEWAVKLFDPKGEVLVLRPDHTVPIARLVATSMVAEKLPLKLSYFNSIFRKAKEADHDLETFQAGVELIGQSGPEADADILILLIETLKSLGVPQFCIDIGHVDFCRDYSAEQVGALLSGDYIALGHIPERGGVDKVAGYSELTKIYDLLQAKGLSEYVYFNRGLVKSLDYYTGLIFEVVIPESAKSIAFGGRYDSLIAKFGYDCPAVGFAVDLSALQDCRGVQC